MSLPFSAAAERNKTVIGDQMHAHFEGATSVLEIGSGTGQHAVYFAARYDHLLWQPTDRAENLAGIRQRIDESGLRNIEPPLELDVSVADPPGNHYNLAFSANTAHIMGMPEVRHMFSLVAASLKPGSHFALYGPFTYGGEHTAPSNTNFDAMLRQQAAHMGIREKSELDAIALDVGLDFIEDVDMPANNRLLLWQR